MVPGWSTTPSRGSYDVVIVGGAIYGSATAFWLTKMGFQGSILVVERDPTYTKCSTAHTNSCIRQQFSNPLNVKISQFGAEFIHNFREIIGDDRAPEITIQSLGYLYLADNQAFADSLRASWEVQHAAGAATVLMTSEEIAAKWPFYHTDDLILGSINPVNEGYWDGGTAFEWFRRKARGNGAEYIANEVTAMTLAPGGGRVESVTLASGEAIACGQFVNASGPRANRTAAMAGLAIPVEPRKRFSWVFSAERPLEVELPLTIDPSGVHLRQDGPKTYLAGGHADHDPAVDFDDFAMDGVIWEEKIWPAIYHRIPQFDSLRIVTEWAGHYAYNTFDHNAIVGPHPDVSNFLFLNGFSGHGLQQSPAIGRGMAELIAHGEYRSLDLTPFRFERIAENAPFLEKAVI